MGRTTTSEREELTRIKLVRKLCNAGWPGKGTQLSSVGNYGSDANGFNPCCRVLYMGEIWLGA